MRWYDTHTLATLGFTKRTPMPGTLASALSLVPVAFIPQRFFLSFLIPMILGGSLLAFFSLKDYCKNHPKEKDPGHVVIDEVVGQWCALLTTQGNLALCLLGFALFRLLDIRKPSLIGYIDALVPRTLNQKAICILADDIVAGLAATALIGIGILFF